MAYNNKSTLFLLLVTATVACVGCSSENGPNGRHGDRGRQPAAVFSADISQRLKEHGAKTGDVQASLLWNNFNDLDLHIIDPNGEHIYFAHKRARSGGELDVDMNAGGPESNEPVENIYFPRGKAPAGHYKVLVHHYANHGSADPSAFRCEVLVGTEVHKFSGSLSSGDPIRLVYEFTLDERDADPQPQHRPQFRLFSRMKW